MFKPRFNENMDKSTWNSYNTVMLSVGSVCNIIANPRFDIRQPQIQSNVHARTGFTKVITSSLSARAYIQLFLKANICIKLSLK